jgi:DNA-binding IclR family transcriptional regulator
MLSQGFFVPGQAVGADTGAVDAVVSIPGLGYDCRIAAFWAIPVAEPGAKTSIQVIERMMDLLDALAHAAEPVNLKRLANETGLHPSTAHRILNVLVEYRMVDRVEPGTYRLGIRLLELGNLVKSRINLRDEALPFMRELHQELHETVNLSVRQGDEMVYVERIHSDRSAMRVVHLIGARAPLHITAVGKIFLLQDGLEKVPEYATRTGLPVFTKNTIRDAPALARELERSRKLGFAFDNEEAENGVSCIGAGIYDDEGRLVAGLSISAPSNRLDKAWGPRVREAADAISRAIGHRAGVRVA